MRSVLVAAAAGMELVSQTWTSDAKFTYDSTAIPSPTSTKITFALDVDTMDIYQFTVAEVDMPQYKVKSTSESTMIYNVADKKSYTNMKTSTTTGDQPPQEHASCTIADYPNMKDVETVKKCFHDAIADVKPTSSEGGVDRYDYKMEGSGADGTTSMYLDSSNLIQKLHMDMKMPDPIKGQHVDIPTKDAKAEKPDASLFKPGNDWPKCDAAKEQPMPKDMPAALVAFAKCAGLDSPSQFII